MGYSLETLARFVESLLESGYDGDIVLGVLPWDEDPTEETREIYEYLIDRAKFHHVILYEIDLRCLPDEKHMCQMNRRYQNVTTMEFLPDFRRPRAVSQLRYEYYWAWAQAYGPQSRILLSDSRDLFFQLNPFNFIPSDMEYTLFVAIEDVSLSIHDQWVNVM
ncbi:hypothetical protein IV203_033901 [Nitzschia inconspicua]|uniref:Uncharacterized protein n=1 Tax=Nitzschia inconspicua TaxID=303405 RepID=A0A9K3M3K0_9STRA|nr:hypothetical protein IV203_033901 [Nitzschia inconspicua]